MEAEISAGLGRGGGLLLVGEGDFSFSVALFGKMRSPFVSSTVETRDSLRQRHAHADDNVVKLEQWGCRVRYGVDATSLHQDDFGHPFSCIVFNFPHVGGKSNIKRNRELLKLFFLSASRLLLDDGRILVTLCGGQGGTEYDSPRRQWHNSWQLTAMAAEARLILTKAVPFSAGHYPEYGSTGYRSQDKQFRTESAVTHVLVKSASNDIDQLLPLLDAEDGPRACFEDVYLSHVASRCLVTSDGHPCKLLLDVLVTTLNARVVQAPALQYIRPVDAAAASAADYARLTTPCAEWPTDVFCEIEEAVTIVHRIERCAPDGLLAAVSSPGGNDDSGNGGGFVGLRYAAYVTLPARGAFADSLERLLGIRFEQSAIDPFADGQRCCGSSSGSLGSSRQVLRLSYEPLSADRLVPVVIVDDGDSGAGCSQVGELACLVDKARCLAIKLDLTAMAVRVFGLPADRWLWSGDRRLLASCQLRPFEAGSDCRLGGGGTASYAAVVSRFIPWSVGSPSYSHDLSVWVDPATFSLTSLCQLVQNVTGLCGFELRLVDVYRQPSPEAGAASLGRCSHCYRICFRSVDAALTYAQSYACYQRIRGLACSELGYEVR